MKVMVTVFYLLGVQPARENNSVGQIRNILFCGFFLRGRSKHSFFSQNIYIYFGEVIKKKNHYLNLIDKHFTPEEINITMLWCTPNSGFRAVSER